jgi:Uma2 family endonuclease
MSPLSTAKMTSKQYLMLGEDPPGVHLELAHGEIVVSPSPAPDHSEIIFNLTQVLGPHVKRGRLGKFYLDTDTLFDDENTRRPDLAFFARSRLHLVGKKALMGPPDLCIEVLSPFNIEMDREDKFALYEKRGVPHYWIVDPDARTIEVYALQRGKFRLVAQGQGDDTVHLPPFADLPIPLAEVWPEV